MPTKHLSYARPNLPRQLFDRLKATAKKLGHGRWSSLLVRWLDYTDVHPDLFRKR
jgi:hypothetical protein